jgi:DNA-binding transcriptional MerR regulator
MAVRIGEIARRAGVATSALRYYEAAGLLPAAERTPAGYRLYPTELLGRLEFIQRAQALGLSLNEIKELIASRGADAASERGRLRHVVAHKLAEVQRRETDLRALKAELEGMYVRLLRSPGPECGHVGDCGCWLPNDKEVMAMSTEIKAVKTCGCDGCPDPDCGCDCDCCRNR